VAVAALVDPEWLVDIEAVAFVPDRERVFAGRLREPPNGCSPANRRARTLGCGVDGHGRGRDGFEKCGLGHMRSFRFAAPGGIVFSVTIHQGGRTGMATDTMGSADA
jgi:hypothetical protein